MFLAKKYRGTFIFEGALGRIPEWPSLEATVRVCAFGVGFEVWNEPWIWKVNESAPGSKG